MSFGSQITNEYQNWKRDSISSTKSTKIPWQFHFSVLLTVPATLPETDISSKTYVISDTTPPLLFTISQSAVSQGTRLNGGTMLHWIMKQTGRSHFWHLRQPISRPRSMGRHALKQSRSESLRASLAPHTIRYSVLKEKLFLKRPMGNWIALRTSMEQVWRFNKASGCKRDRKSWIK